MFKIPDWDADIAANQVDFLNNISKNKLKYGKDKKLMKKEINKPNQQITSKIYKVAKRNKIKSKKTHSNLSTKNTTEYESPHVSITNEFSGKFGNNTKDKIGKPKKKKKFKNRVIETTEPETSNVENYVSKQKSDSGSATQNTEEQIVNRRPSLSEKPRKSKKKHKNKQNIKVNGTPETQNNDSKVIKQSKTENELQSAKKLTKKKQNKVELKNNVSSKTPEVVKSPKKRKANGAIVNTKEIQSGFNIKVKDLDFDKADELIVSAKKKKLNDSYKKEDKAEELFPAEKINKVSLKMQKFKLMLEKNDVTRNSIKVNGNDLRTRMLERLKAAQFRYLNEKLYTSTGSEAQKLFQSDPSAFQTYHQGYQLQVKKWPVNPLDVIVKKILKMPKTHLIADMGCGEAALAKRVPHTVRSFDLVTSSPGVEACDMARTPLLSSSMDAAVYCLALMGTELTQYLVEANRVLKMGGQLLIAEVESRFEDVDSFTRDVEKLGFKLKNLDKSHNVFFFMQFTKIRDPPAKKSKLPALSLKPCLYKKR